MSEGVRIELKGVSRSFREGEREHVVLSDLDAVFEPGEFSVLLGRSGSGKSTLLNLIAGLEIPDTGSIHFGDLQFDRLTERERTLFRRRHIGYVFQSFNLIPTLTVAENVELPLDLEHRPEAPSRARELLSRVNLADRGGSFPDRLSGGEQQRVAIARALVADPAVVLADEPTGNLDLETGQEVLAFLERLVAERGTTLVMATHSREVMGRASRILELRHGQLEKVHQ